MIALWRAMSNGYLGSSCVYIIGWVRLDSSQRLRDVSLSLDSCNYYCSVLEQVSFAQFIGMHRTMSPNASAWKAGGTWSREHGCFVKFFLGPLIELSVDQLTYRPHPRRDRGRSSCS